MKTTKDKREINKLVKLLGSDKQSFELLYKKMYDTIFWYLKYNGADDETIKDVISETFIVVYEKAQTKMFYKNCYFWILKIAKNILRNYNRKYKREVSFENIEFDKEDPNSYRACNFAEIEEIIDRLSDEDNNLLFLRAVKEMKFCHIAKLLNISEPTVKRKYKELKNYIKKMRK